jgi:hypothetical protein
MTAERSEKPAEKSTDFEGEIRELFRSRDVAYLRPEGKVAPDVGNLNSLLQRVSGTSTGEIDDLIEQLQEMREFLRSEGTRVQQEIAGYAKASQAVRSHVEQMSDVLAEWRQRMENVESPPVAVTHD